MKKIIIIVYTLILLTVGTYKVYAQDYVLPYPGAMPGNKVYLIYEFIDTLKKYYSFGDFASFKYNISQSDKYLVEAKVLFEYHQYPLAILALNKSNNFFIKAKNSLQNAKRKNKNTSEKESVFHGAKNSHIHILEKLKTELPKDYVWKDEKKEAITLNLHNKLENAIKYRLK